MDSLSETNSLNLFKVAFQISLAYQQTKHKRSQNSHHIWEIHEHSHPKIIREISSIIQMRNKFNKIIIFIQTNLIIIIMVIINNRNHKKDMMMISKNGRGEIYNDLVKTN